MGNTTSNTTSTAGKEANVSAPSPVERPTSEFGSAEAYQPDYTYDMATSAITCKCGYQTFDWDSYVYHAESMNRRCPKQAPFDVSGWSARMFQIIPYLSGMQRGVVANGAFDNGAALVITLNDTFDEAVVKKVISNIPAQAMEMTNKYKTPVVAAVGIDAKTWSKWDSSPPTGLKSFQEIKAKDSGETLFPAQGGGDILVWTKCSKSEVCYEFGRQILLALGSNAKEYSQTLTFKYGGGKDLTGFIDGTRNPDHLLRAIVDEVAIFPQDQNGDHVSGCYIYAGKFVHNLPKFFAMPDHHKSQIIGRDYSKEEPHKRGYDRRIENPRLDEDEYMDEKPKAAPHEPAKTRFHTARGHGSMYRQAMPFSEGPNQGLFFIAFSRMLSEFESALQRMAGHFQADGSTDALFDITKAISSGYYYCPSLSELAELANLNSKMITSVAETRFADDKVVNEGKPINIVFEYCTNCGYKTIFLEKKKILERFGAKGQVNIIENPQIPRLAAFEIALEDGTVLFSKRALPDGMNNFPWCWPSDEELIIKLRKYYGDTSITDEDIKKAEKARNTKWGLSYWDQQNPIPANSQ